MLFFYSDKESSDDIAISNKANGGVSINLASQFFCKYNEPSLNKKIDNNIIRDNLSLKLVLILFHKVFAYKKGDFVNSPNIFFHREKNNIVNLVNKFSFDKGENYINIIRDPFSDSGNFLEYFFGESEYGYISELIEIMLKNDVDLHFLFNNNLWHEKIGILQEYIKLKYLVYKFNPKLLPGNNFNDIDEEVKEIQKIIKENNIPQNIESKIIHIKKDTNSEENPIIGKSNSILSRKYSDIAEYKHYENLPIDILQKKLKEPNTSEQLKNIIREIMFSRIIKH